MHRGGGLGHEPAAEAVEFLIRFRHEVVAVLDLAGVLEARAAGDESSRNRLVPVVVDDTPALATESSRPGGEIEIVVAGEVRIVVRGAVELSALRTVLAVLRG